MAQNNIFLVPVDHEETEKGIMSRDLFEDVIHGRIGKIQRKDFSEIEEQYDEIMKPIVERYVELARRAGKDIQTKEEYQKRAYMYYHPNREFTGRFEHRKLKKVDDGTFVDNGYR